VRCLGCDAVYAAAPPDESFLGQAYGEADYDSREEAAFAAGTYARSLSLTPFLAGLDKTLALDVGAGDGAMLAEYLRLGFGRAVGVEPSLAAIAAAPPEIQKFLRPGLFSPEMVADLRPNLVSSFMTLEHLKDPGDFLGAARELLAPGGLAAVVVHNWRAALNRILGRWSPIIDVEHLQLFSPRSVERLFTLAGFGEVRVIRLKNRYPFGYWLRLVPLPAGVKNRLLGLADRTGLSRAAMSFNVGNILAVGRKQ
jgi:SAM-dependent methyltransferase